MGERIDIQEAPDWVKRLGPKLRTAALRGMVSAAHRLVGVIVTEVIPKEPRLPVDKGIYKAAWRVQPLRNGALVFNDSPAAAIIEDGVRAENVKIGKAMIDALTEWVKRKRIAGDEDARGVAWAIAKSMEKNGIFERGRGLHILEKASKKVNALIKEEIEAEIEKLND